MEAYDILTSVKQLEQSGMERSESEAVARVIQAAVAPLATDKSLKTTNKDLAVLREDVAELKGDLIKLDAKITVEANKMGMNLIWGLTTLVFLINGLFFAFERTL